VQGRVQNGCGRRRHPFLTVLRSVVLHDGVYRLDVHVLEWVLENGGNWNNLAWTSAAFGGQLALLSLPRVAPHQVDEHKTSAGPPRLYVRSRCLEWQP
jgi:hypothetical protein